MFYKTDDYMPNADWLMKYLNTKEILKLRGEAIKYKTSCSYEQETNAMIFGHKIKVKIDMDFTDLKEPLITFNKGE